MTTHTAFVPCIDFSERLIAEIQSKHFIMAFSHDRPRKMPPVAVIRAEWKTKFATMRNAPLPPDHQCWQCGFVGRLERAHVLARYLGGTDEPGNLWMLCKNCHDETEHMDLWYKVHAFVDPFGAIRDEHGVRNLDTWRMLNGYENAWRFNNSSDPEGISRGIFPSNPNDRVTILDDETIMAGYIAQARIHAQDNQYGLEVLRRCMDRIIEATKTKHDVCGTLFDLAGGRNKKRYQRAIKGLIDVWDDPTDRD